MSIDIAEPKTKDIVTIAPGTALTVFTTEGAIDPLLEHVRREIDAFKPSIATAKGRKEIASMARRVADSKVYLESVGKKLADEQKEIPKKIDAARKRIRDTLDKWRDEVRAPLTEWEDAEEARIAKHKGAIQRLEHAGREPSDCSPVVLRAALANAQQMIIGPHLEEFEAEYARAKDGAVARLGAAIAAAERREAEAAELARLRKEAEERAERDRIAAIERAAADKARAEAEATAKAEREAAERRELDLKLAAERAEREAKEREEAIVREAEEARQREALAAERGRLDAERRELELQREKEAAERRAAETEARLKREAEQAKARDEADARAREADIEHRRSINREAMAALVKGGLDETYAMLAVSLIAERKIPRVTISY